MLQRIQTVYLLLAASISGGLIFVFNLWGLEGGTKVWAKDINYVFAAFITSAFFSLVAILRYKNRKSQFMLGRLNIILNFILLGFFVYQSLNLSGETSVSEKGIGMFIPIISIVFLALANKAIKKDEDLVKSVDRLR
jgi:phosphoglycerol transferase MdoB-like AlkP superfamily enzyme